MERLTRHTVVVHTSAGQSLRGVLVGVHRDCLVLVHAQYLGEVGVEPVDGEVIVPREKVAWIQRIGEAQ